MKTRRVVITGLGALTPIGNTLNTFWENSLKGISGAAPITKFDASKFKTQFACELKNFNPEDFIPKSEARRYDLFTQYALIAVEEALKNGQIDLDTVDKNRVGVIWGSGNGGMTTFQEEVMAFAKGDGTPRFNPFFIPKTIADIASGIISIKYGLRGPNFTTISACATSTTALIDAFNYIKWGKAEMIISGGSEAPISESGIGGFNAARALSMNNAHPQEASKPFDVARDGFVMGEGAGALVLEELDHALARNATIYGEVLGGGMAADAYHLTGTHPQGEGAYLGMVEAIKDANLSPAQIDYVNAHATSTPLGDQSELIAIERVFETKRNVSISATKSMTGHLLGAAGAIEAILSVLACKEDCVPPTINAKNIDPQYQYMDLGIKGVQNKKVDFALSNTFGFGGHIAALVVGKYKS